jgi:micrococcal nuclease
MNTIKLFLVVCLFLITLVSNSQTLRGKVVGIMDGDTFKLLTPDSTLVKVRLANIDCPEKKQPFSGRAKEFTAKAIFGKTVIINIQKTDRYKRYISDVIYNDTLSLCHELVKHGLAWHYVKYSKDSTLQDLEDRAKEEKVGLWQDRNPIAPWVWRSSKKKKKSASK